MYIWDLYIWKGEKLNKIGSFPDRDAAMLQIEHLELDKGLDVRQFSETAFKIHVSPNPNETYYYIQLANK